MPAARPLVALAAAAGLIALAPAPAAAGYRLTFTGTFDYSDYESGRFDGTNGYDDDLPPLFDLDRLDGGTFRATLTLTRFAPDQGIYEFAPPAPVAFALYDAAGAVVHAGAGGVSEVEVRNDQSRRGRPPYTDEVSASVALAAVTGLALPPELYGPNVLRYGSSLVFSSTFRQGFGPLDDFSIPTDPATYLAFDDRYFALSLTARNGATDGDGPRVYVDTYVEYVVTGASVERFGAAVPEPASVGLAVAGGLGLVTTRLRRRAAR